ncbi:SRPBCC domain-containing protein [Pedobacter namyangjuensis]|uniref:SRPBCC domain-containing protein n=1 Tax=Pedobacter namyangjuensis TaxID=600626 RepID=UPI000DE37EDD|nr:SRPBCC domain-containing protein [Pedobacter namyangjuensis]
MNTAEKTKITVKTIVHAPLAKVWEYWTSPAHIQKWNQASEDWETTKASNNLVVGGSFSSTMAAKDGSMSFDFNGSYTQVDTNKFIAYTIADGRTVTVSFTQKAESVEIIEIFEAENVNSKEMQQAGWQAILDNFKKYTEAN